MPRNGAGIYTLPPGSVIANGDVSDASDINTPLADIVADLNAARPIVSGGTGATSAAAALAALGGPTLTSIAALGTAADKMLYSTALNAWAETPITAAGRALLDDADAAAQRETLGLGAVTAPGEVVADLDTIAVSGWARFASGAANAPIADNSGYVLTITSDSIGVQMAWGHLGSADNTFAWMRWRASNGWRPWVRLYGSEREIRAFAIGEGQTWQDVTASRSGGTSYQNATGRPIQVSLHWFSSGASMAQVSADGTTWVNVGANNTAQAASCAQFLVPPGHYYRTNNAIGIYLWAELR